MFTSRRLQLFNSILTNPLVCKLDHSPWGQIPGERVLLRISVTFMMETLHAMLKHD
jgi:hypothetical protein